MKSILTTVVCLLALFCQGQEIRPRIGLTMNTGTFPNALGDLDVSFTPGFLTGLDLQVPINDEFSITSELLFVQKGYRIDFEFEPSSGTTQNYTHLATKTRVNYADLLFLPTSTWSNFYFMAGPGLSFGLFGYNYNALTNTNGQVTTSSSKIHFNESAGSAGDYYLTKRLVLTGVAGVGITLWELLLVDLRYQFSPTQYPYPSGVQDNNRSWYHSLQLTTALRIIR